jgi:hypothetical protein
MNAETIDDRILRFIKQELSKEGAYLLPYNGGAHVPVIVSERGRKS